jgi:thiosulfate/3-mercaptopyruvate sulfurtransferase
MRFLTVAASLLLVSLPAASTLPAEDADNRLVVTTGWLAQHLSDADLVLLHVGDRSEYDAGHVPGARYVAFNTDLAVTDTSAGGLRLQMLPAEVLRERLAALGVSDNSRIVVYYGKDWVSPAARVIFTLDYAGLGPATSLLDGGMGAWMREGRPLATDVPPARAGTLSALKIRPIVVDAEYVHGQLTAPNVSIVDSRTPAFYEGTQAGGSKDLPHRAGHIPGARNVPFTTLTNEDLTVRSIGELKEAFAKAGVKPTDAVITYCHIGQQATATAFAARMLGHRVLLYDGSFEDWSRRTEYPVEASGGKQP